jgi:hypothetical protein
MRRRRGHTALTEQHQRWAPHPALSPRGMRAEGGVQHVYFWVGLNLGKQGRKRVFLGPEKAEASEPQICRRPGRRCVGGARVLDDGRTPGSEE